MNLIDFSDCAVNMTRELTLLVNQKLTDQYVIPTKYGRDDQVMPTKTQFVPTKW